MYKIRTYNAIAPLGLERFPAAQYAVGADVDAADAVLLRSHKLGVDELSSGLRAIAVSYTHLTLPTTVIV